MSHYGVLFRTITFGESHGVAIGAVVEGCPAGVYIDETFIQQELRRRRPGQSAITTSRQEEDKVKIISGTFENHSTGAPIAMMIENNDSVSADYDHLINSYRPSHADYTYEKKYGLRDYRGGGRSSARETVARVAAGAIAKLILRKSKTTIYAYVSQIGFIKAPVLKTISLEDRENNSVRCPHKPTADKMVNLLNEVRKEGDTLGGMITCLVQNAPVGLGEPVFDKLHAELGKAMLSINAVKGFEYGSGFGGISLRGSEHNDIFYMDGDRVRTRTNHSGGIQGGISNGEDIYFNVAFKPVSTILQNQQSLNKQGEEITLAGKGRHDPCVVPRAVPIVESMAALVLVDFILRNKVSQL